MSLENSTDKNLSEENIDQINAQDSIKSLKTGGHATKSVLTFAIEYISIIMFLKQYTMGRSAILKEIIETLQSGNNLSEDMEEADYDFDNFILQMIYGRVVNNFLNFMSDIATEVVISNPNLLKSNEQVRMDHVLKFSSMEDFIRDATEKKINSLAYEPFKTMLKYFGDRFGMQGVVSEADQQKINIMIEFRNIITHNRGAVNSVFMSKMSGIFGEIKPDFPVKEGERLIFRTKDVLSGGRFLNSIALNINRELSSKYPLRIYKDDEYEQVFR